MKGLGLHQEQPTKYLAVKYNTICETSKQPREGFKEIKIVDNTTGDEIIKYIRAYDFVEGMVTGIEWRDTGKQYKTRFMSWKLSMNAAGIPIVLEIPLKSAAGDRFMKLAEQLDFAKPVEFRAWLDTSGDKDKTAFHVLQDGQTVLQKYKKGQMGDCPEAVEELDGWNYSAQLKYLHGQLMNVVIPRLEAARAMAGEHPSPSEDERDPFAGEDEDLDADGTSKF